MAVITLTTDFGLQDEFAGVMKGVILSINPDARIVDISHQVRPQQLDEAAYMIDASYRFFSPQTVHVVVVDPGVGSSRSIIALQTDGHTFIAPDNGVLSLVIKKGEVVNGYRVLDAELFLNKTSHTFHGRDIFAPVAAHVSLGKPVHLLGPAISREELVTLPLGPPEIMDDGSVTGRVITIDRFGNLITNIETASLFSSSDKRRPYVVSVGKSEINRFANTYSDVPKGNLVAVTGSRGYMEIAASCDNAAVITGADKGALVKVRMK